MKSTEQRKATSIPSDGLPELLTITQAAHLLNVHKDTLRNWEKKGFIKPMRIGSRKDRRYKRNEVLKLLK